ncbi:hypothetical protein CTAYLR_010681 [Chrysophaeum taylorii]|uniref:Uncharacterized protein n=1 Tax=Chrysophaeum taylorii TaxID=2483200 RepID=A0AAD7XPR0_9STRA|nr:hypothetical protein CTAYLR_010681 [Chrysophaeum taylorii]
MAVAERSERGVVNIYDAATQRRRKMLQHADIGSKEIIYISFSADSKFCLTQGGAPEWQLVLWTFDRAAKPIAAFKTSTQSGPAVYQADFCPRDATVACACGDGILKFLRIAENQFKPIQHNMKREPQNYLCHCWLPEDRFVVATDTGDLLLFEGFEFRATLARPKQAPVGVGGSTTADGSAGSAQGDANQQGNQQHINIDPTGSINSLVAFSKGFVCGCADGILCVFERADDSRETFKCAKVFNIEGNSTPITNLAVSPSEETLCCATQNSQMYTFTLSNTDILKDDATTFELLSTAFHGPGPRGSAKINALDVCTWKPLVVTCGDDRTLRVWNYHERTVELIKKYSEEILSVALHPSGLLAIAGFSDKVRLVSLLMDDVRTIRELPVIKGCHDCSFAHGGHVFAVANHSVVQIFNTYTCETTANLRGHSSKILAIRWARNDRKLTTVGTDGLVLVWRVREGTKDTESSQRLSYHGAVGTPDLAKVFTVADDQCIRELTPANGIVVKTKSCGGRLTCVELSATQRLLFVGCSASDDTPGVVQVHVMLNNWESTEPKIAQCAAMDVSCLKLSRDGGLLFAGGADGSLCMFEVHDVDQRGVVRSRNNAQQQQQDSGGAASSSSGGGGISGGGSGAAGGSGGQPEIVVEEILVTKSDIEAKSVEMQQLRNKVEELTLNNDYQLRLKDMKYKDRISEITDKFSSELQADAKRCEDLATEKKTTEQNYESRFRALEGKHKTEFKELERTYEGKISTESMRYKSLVSQREAQNTLWEDENRELVDSHARAVKEVTTKYEAEISEEHETQTGLAREKEEVVAYFTKAKDLIEEDADMEILEIRQKYEAKLIAERELTKGLKDNNGHMKKRHSALTKDVEDQKEEIRSLQDKEKELLETIKGLEKDIQGHKKEIREREETIADKEKRIYDLKKKNQELEKFKFVLDYKIKELKRQIEPRENEIADMRKQVEEMDLELDQYHKSNSALDLMIGELRLKMDGMQKEIDHQKRVLHDANAYIVTFRRDLADSASALPSGDHKELKARVRDLYTVYVLKDAPVVTTGSSASKASSSSPSRNDDDKMGDLQAEYNRQREHLERNVDALKRKISRDMKMYVDDRARLVEESTVLVDEMNNLRRESHNLKLKQETIRTQIVLLAQDLDASDEALEPHVRALESRAKLLEDLLYRADEPLVSSANSVRNDNIAQGGAVEYPSALPPTQ